MLVATQGVKGEEGPMRQANIMSDFYLSPNPMPVRVLKRFPRSILCELKDIVISIRGH